MNVPTLIENLRRYIQLEDREAEIFLSLTKTKTIPKKKFLLLSGEVCEYFSLVADGCLMNYFTDENGFEHVLQFATPMWWTADLYSLVSRSPAIYSIKALTDARVLQISIEGLEQLYRDVPKFERYFRIIFQNALVAHQRRIMQNHAFSAEDRYQQFLKSYPTLEQIVPQKYIASYLGITPEFLSKIRRKRR
ncbi:MAG: Crp/Fnr family transcriptional regulator [Bacteroidia bacterium]